MESLVTLHYTLLSLPVGGTFREVLTCEVHLRWTPYCVGFCGSLTTFSSWQLDVFLSWANSSAAHRDWFRDVRICVDCFELESTELTLVGF
jgi:hypothetical protein